jgi:hypothetical protein
MASCVRRKVESTSAGATLKPLRGFVYLGQNAVGQPGGPKGVFYRVGVRRAKGLGVYCRHAHMRQTRPHAHARVIQDNLSGLGVVGKLGLHNDAQAVHLKVHIWPVLSVHPDGLCIGRYAHLGQGNGQLRINGLFPVSVRLHARTIKTPGVRVNAPICVAPSLRT